MSQMTSMPTWGWILIIMAAIVIVAAVLLLLLWWYPRRRRERRRALAATADMAVPVARAETAPQAAATEAPAAPDDLAILEGIGAKTASLLRAAGITTFAQLAASDVARLKGILQQSRLGMIDPASWPEQAELAAAGKWDELKEMQDALKGGRHV